MFEIKRSEMVGGRLDLAAVANVRNLKTAVEVGTDRGLFAADFLARWNGEMLYCVDPYEPYPQMPWNRDGDLMMAAALLAPYARRCRIIRATSKDAAAALGPMDMVYLDGAHDYDNVSRDIDTWWPLVRRGGLLAGHDFDEEHREVKRAVVQFAERQKVRIEVGTEYNAAPSWFIEKS